MGTHFRAAALAGTALLALALALVPAVWQAADEAEGSAESLRICVEVAPGLDLSADDVDVLAAQTAAEAQASSGEDLPLSVEEGCPQGIPALPSLETLRYGLGVVPESNDSPEFDRYVFVVPEAQLRSLPIGPSSTVTTPYQRECNEFGCGPSGLAVFVGR